MIQMCNLPVVFHSQPCNYGGPKLTITHSTMIWENTSLRTLDKIIITNYSMVGVAVAMVHQSYVLLGSDSLCVSLFVCLLQQVTLRKKLAQSLLVSFQDKLESQILFRRVGFSISLSVCKIFLSVGWSARRPEGIAVNALRI